MSLSGRRVLRPGDVVLLCSDGFWTGLADAQIATIGLPPQGRARGLQDALADLGERAVQATAPLADNTTAAAVRWSGE